MPEIVPHPTPRQLALFGRGKLPEAQAANVAAHLQICIDCGKAVTGLSPASDLDEASVASESVSAASPGVSGTGVAPGPVAGNIDVPPELANHPKFRIVRELGRGGMGVIYLAEHLVLQKPFALKVINPSVLDNPGALARFQIEARAAATLDHQNIARAHDADQAGALHFLVMEYVEGMSLDQILRKKGPLSVARACHHVCQAALGLQLASEHGMVHRDIKPHNLMLTPRGRIKILDFGLARLRDRGAAATELTRPDVFMGTPEYVSPEQATDARTADIRADIYSLGCTLYALLTGRPPFTGDTVLEVLLAHIEKEPPPLNEFRSDVPAEVASVLAKMMSKDPAQRYQRPLEVAQALAPFARKGGNVPAPGPAPAQPASTGKAGGADPGSKLGPSTGPPELPPRLRTPGATEELPALDLGPARATAVTGRSRTDRRVVPVRARGWKRHLALAGGGVGVVVLLALVALWVAGGLRGNTRAGILVQDPMDQWFTVGTRWEGKQISTEPRPAESTAWFTVTAREGNRFRGRCVNERRLEWTVEGVLGDDHRSFTWKVLEQAVNDWQPERAPFTFAEGSEQWREGRPRIDWSRSAPPGGTQSAGYMEFTTKRSRAASGEGDKWPPSLHPGKGYCGTAGRWRVRGEELTQDVVVADLNNQPWINFGDYGWLDYDFRMKAMKTGGENGFAVVFDVIWGSKKLTQWCIGQKRNRESYVETCEQLFDRAESTRRTAIVPTTIDDHRWYETLVRVRGKQVQCFLDGQRQSQFTHPGRRGGMLGIHCWRMAARFKDIEVRAPDGTILWKGPPQLP